MQDLAVSVNFAVQAFEGEAQGLRFWQLPGNSAGVAITICGRWTSVNFAALQLRNKGVPCSPSRAGVVEFLLTAGTATYQLVKF